MLNNNTPVYFLASIKTVDLCLLTFSTNIFVPLHADCRDLYDIL